MGTGGVRRRGHDVGVRVPGRRGASRERVNRSASLFLSQHCHRVSPCRHKEGGGTRQEQHQNNAGEDDRIPGLHLEQHALARLK